MSSTDAKELLKEQSKVRKQISELRYKLNTLNNKKEGVFKEKDEFSENIVKLISQIKILKKERDTFTKKVKELKKEREDNNNKIKEYSLVLKDLPERKDQFGKRQEKKINPDSIKKEMEQLEFKIETEGMSFDKEKKVMLIINELKKTLDGAKESIEANKKIREARNGLRDARRKANAAHRQVQDNARLSQEKHEKILKLSKEIDSLKEKEKEFYSKFSDEKQEFNKVNSELKELIVILNNINNKLKDQKVKTNESKIKEDRKNLKEKSKEVDEKIKSRKKLTTEDLLVFQKNVEKEESVGIKTSKKNSK